MENLNKIFGFPENLMMYVKNESPEFDKVLSQKMPSLLKEKEFSKTILIVVLMTLRLLQSLKKR